MIYFCADDYGLSDISDEHILRCIKEGVLNKVSVFPNLGAVDLQKLPEDKVVKVSLHLNLVEGKCMANPKEIDLLADENGNLKHTFGGLFKLGLLPSKKFRNQVFEEVKAQVLFWKSALPEGMPFCIDSHQHTHMIPVVFEALLRVLREEKIKVEYMRIPTEPISPYIKTPSLMLTYSIVNLIKQWLLNFLWTINKRAFKNAKIPSAYFCGILFSGKMDKKRVGKILPKYIELAQKQGRDVEVLFHPGYLEKGQADFGNKNIVFEGFYLSENRKTEFEAAMKLLK